MLVKHMIGDFEGFFEGGKIYLTPKWSQSQLTKVGTSQTIRTSGTLAFLCTGATRCPKSLIIVLVVFKMFRKLSMQKMRHEYRQKSVKMGTLPIV
jgi:hypothetical protein